MTTVKWLPKARDDLDRLYEFIAQYSPEAAAKALRTLIQAGNSLSQFPEKGRPWDLDDRFRELSVPFGARAYVIRYRIHIDAVFVIRVWHVLEDR